VLKNSPYFQKKVGRGTACADYDKDGDLDLLIANCKLQTAINHLYCLRNDRQNDNHWSFFRIIGNQRNRDGVSSIIRYTLNGKSRILQLQRTASYLSANDPYWVRPNANASGHGDSVAKWTI